MASSTEDMQQWPRSNPYFHSDFIDVPSLTDNLKSLKFEKGLVYYLQRKDGQSNHLTSVADDLPGLESGCNNFGSSEDGTLEVYSVQFGSPNLHGAVIRMDQEIWQWMLLHLHIHPSFVNLLSANYEFSGAYATYVDMDDETGHITAYHLLVKFLSGGFFQGALYFRVRPCDSSFTKTLVLISSDAAMLYMMIMKYLNALGSTVLDPFALILLLLQKIQFLLYNRNRRFSHEAAVLEVRTGLGSLATGDRSRVVSPDHLDTSYMHGIVGNLRVANSAYYFQLEFIGKVQSAREEFQNFLNAGNLHGSGPRKHIAICQEFELLKTQCKWQHTAGLVALERGLAQLDGARMLVDQLVARRSELIAESSKTTAEESHSIAQRSQTIAEETRKDSLSMKTIASLTMCYLPATFMATIFSTQFFSINNGENGGLRVESHFWIYIVASLILTLLTVLVWVALSPGLTKDTFGNVRGNIKGLWRPKKPAPAEVPLSDLC